MFNHVTVGLRGMLFLMKFALRHQENLVPIIKSIRHFNSKIRISTSAVLLVKNDDDYVLVKNHHRPEFYAPIGGVYKHTGKKPEILEKIEWQADYTLHTPKLEDMKNDLRGIIIGRRFPEFLNWFTSRRGREGEQCIYRELREELLEGSVGKSLRDRSADIKLELFRRVLEGPHAIDGRSYQAQFRYFEVYRPDMTHDLTAEFFNEVVKRARQNDNHLTVAKEKEIIAGRTELARQPIAPHAKYFFSSEWHGIEPVKY